MAIRIDRRLLAVVLLSLVGAAVVSAQAFPAGAPQVKYMFGLGPYPGGTLKAVFEMQRADEEGIVHTYTVTIVPDGDKYDVTENWSNPGQSADDIHTGPRSSGAAGAVGARYDEKQKANIDLTPLQTLDERNVELAPNQTYYLPDGARLVTQDWDEIAGVRVLRATFLHPSYANQRVQLAFTDPDTAALLPFPILMIKEVDGKMDQEMKLVQLDYTP